MKLRCKKCQKKIKLADYNCPFCGEVNFATDDEVRAAYKARAPKGIGAAFAGAFVAVNTAVVTFIIIISLIIGAVIISVYSSQKANNDRAFEHAAEWTGFEKLNSGGRFELTRVYSESTYPYYVMYLTYSGEPEDFIRESITLCYNMYQNVDRCDDYSFSVKCGDMAFVCTRSRYVETNMLFDYSELELFGLKSLTVYTNRMTDEDIQNIENANYSFEVYLK